MIYIIIYGILLCLGRFSGVGSTAYMPLFTLFEDPTLYPGDIYVHNLQILTSYLFPALNVFGGLSSNTYFIFFLFVVVSLLHIYFIFKIAELLFPNLRRYNVGLISLLLFLYDYPIFSAHSQLVSQHHFSQTIVAMPMLAAGLYDYLRGNILRSIFILFVLAVPLHFKSVWFLGALVAGDMVFSYRKYSFRQIRIAIGWVFLGALVMYWYKMRSMGVHPSFDFTKRLEICKLIFERETEENVVLMNSLAYFLKFFFVMFSGWFSIRFIEDKELLRKLRSFYVFTWAVFVFGFIYTSSLYQWFPVPEIAILAFPRAMAYPIILSILLMGGGFVTLLVKSQANGGNKLPKAVLMAGLFLLAFFPNFKGSIIIYALCIAAAAFFVYGPLRLSERLKLYPFAAWFYLAVIFFLVIRDGSLVMKSYKMRSPFFPFIVYNLDRDSYDCQLWARKNTSKDSVFVFLKPAENSFYNEAGFRRFSARPMLLGDYANFYFNYGLVQEHFKRERFINELGEAIRNHDPSKVKGLLAGSPWRLDYLVLPVNFSLEGYKKVYENNSYACYLVASREAL